MKNQKTRFALYRHLFKEMEEMRAVAGLPVPSIEKKCVKEKRLCVSEKNRCCCSSRKLGLSHREV
jgi:hypothetical protein